MTRQPDIQYVIFDLGGVLIELDGPPLSPGNTNLSEAEIWQHWLRSEAVRLFESGRCDKHEFATRLISEFKLNMEAGQLLEEFERWPVGFFPESHQTVQALQSSVGVACLSNTNGLHAQRFKAESDVYDHFDKVFFSHEMGLLKPDPEIYLKVQAEVPVSPEQILFLDDNQTNVATARSLNWQSELTKGPLQVRDCLKQYNLL